MKRSTKMSWSDVDGRDTHRLVVAPDNYRPDLVSPIGSARSPVPPIRSRQLKTSPTSGSVSKYKSGLSDENDSSQGPATYSADFEASTQTMNKGQYSDDFESSHVSASYTTDFEHPTSSHITAQYSDDFESTSRPGKSVVTSDSMTRSVDTGPTDQTASEEILTMFTGNEDSLLGSVSGTMSKYNKPRQTDSGHTSRLTVQYSEDFEEETPFDEITVSSETETETDSLATRRQGTVDDQSAMFTSSESISYQTDHTTSEQTSEHLDERSHVAQQVFLRRTLERLQQAKHSQPHPDHESCEVSGGIQQTTRVSIGPGQTEKGHQTNKSVNAMRNFCMKVKEKLLSKTANPVESTSPVDEAEVHLYKLQKIGLTPGDCVEDHGVCHFALNRLRLENTQNRLEKIAKQPFHDPKTCPDCLSMYETFARQQFIKEKLHQAEERKIKEKVDYGPTYDLSSLLVKDPAKMPGQLQEKFGHLEPWMIWSHMSQVKREELADTQTGKQTEMDIQSSDTDNIDQLSAHSAQITICPHILPQQKFQTQDTGTAFLEQTLGEAERVKQDLTAELNHLNSLNSKEFWQLYFSKLSQSSLHEKLSATENQIS